MRLLNFSVEPRSTKRPPPAPPPGERHYEGRRGPHPTLGRGCARLSGCFAECELRARGKAGRRCPVRRRPSGNRRDAARASTSRQPSSCHLRERPAEASAAFAKRRVGARGAFVMRSPVGAQVVGRLVDRRPSGKLREPHISHLRVP